MVEVEEIEKGEKRSSWGRWEAGMRFLGRDEAVWATGELVVGLGEVRKAAKEGLLAMSVAVGLKVMAEMMEEEVTRKVGPKHAKLTERRGNSSPHCSGVGRARWPKDKGSSSPREDDRGYRGAPRHLRRLFSRRPAHRGRDGENARRTRDPGGTGWPTSRSDDQSRHARARRPARQFRGVLLPAPEGHFAN